MSAEMFGASLAGEKRIGVFGESLRVQEEDNFPEDEKNDSDPQKTPGVQSRYEEERGEHHSEVPVVDAAGNTAAVFEEPCLERTEEQYADHVRYGE